MVYNKITKAEELKFYPPTRLFLKEEMQERTVHTPQPNPIGGKIMNINNHVHKLLDHATRKPEKFTRIHRDNEGRYWMLRSQTRIPVIRLTATVFCKNTKIYNFDTSNSKQNQIAIIFKRDKELAIIDTGKNTFYFGGVDEREDEAKFTAVVRIVIDGEIRLILADTHSESLDIFSSDNEADGDATEALLNIMTGEIPKTQAVVQEVKEIENFSYC